MFSVLIVVTLAMAAADWLVVSTGNKRLEYLLKPATMVALIAACVSMTNPDPGDARLWIVLGLCASLIGDVFLIEESRFIQGLASFLIAHVLYIVGFLTMGVSVGSLLVGLVVAVVGIVVVGRRIAKGATRHDPVLGRAVAAYIGVISAMVTVAIGTGRPWAIIGALLFYSSDAFIGWSRFVKGFARQDLAIIVTYHLGQIGIVLSLLPRT